MPNIKPDDIRDHEFKRSVRGYDRDEVRYFLAMIADEFEHLLRDFEHLSKSAGDKDTSKLVKQQTESEEIIKKAKDHADLVLRGAQSKASLIVQEARKKAVKIETDLAKMQTERNTLSIKMRRMLQSQLELLDLLEDDAVDLDSDTADALGEDVSDNDDND